MLRPLAAILLAALLKGCGQAPAPEPTDPPVRGLVTTLISATEETVRRRYPGVLEPGELNVLAFEVGGKMGRLDLSVGERVDEGQVLAKLDVEQYVASVERSRAALEGVEVRLKQAEEDLQRSEALLARGAVTRVRRDQDRTTAQQTRTERDQAQQTLNEAEENLRDTALVSPFDGIVSAIEVDSFATVSAGRTILSLYEADAFEVSFFVSFEVSSQLVVGTPATVRLADDPSVQLPAAVSELGERADTVSSFPVVVRLTETVPQMKAGMAVEVSFEFAVPGTQGFLVPLTAIINEGRIVAQPVDARTVQRAPVYVYDPATSTVKRRMIAFTGLRGNSAVAIEGLAEGERVASKGVSFLRDGMAVKLLDGED
ncbi:MAG: efflux RND transporter periplasmic adaptor subunit [Pseudomonadota bacterium]